MHVILTILKILGILLLVILGLLLAIVLSVLFVPVRYQLEGEKPSPGWSEANGKIRVSWLLHLIHLRIQYREKELDWECYLFGVPLKKAGAALKRWKKKRRRKKGIILESMEFPEPVIRVAIEPKTKAGQEKMGIALAKLAEEDPTFRAYTDEETGQTIIAGMGELHLEIIVDRMLREFKVEANVGKPQVAYKETIRKPASSDTKYARQSGGKGQYGHVKINIEPNPNKGYEFVNNIVGGAIPKEYIEPANQGIQGAMQSGVIAGYPVVDVKVTLYDGSYHEVDSSEMAFKIAGSMAFKDASKKADPVLLEPIMKVTVIVPEEYMGDVIGDLNSRRGEIQGFEERTGAKQINAHVPLSEMFGYATDLRSKTQGRGQYVMEPDGYKEVPKSIAEKIISERTKKD